MDIRVIHDGAHDGPTNMARDEALLERVGAGAAPPTLRLYQWDSPTISLGYFQEYADYEMLDPPAGNLPVVRRQTGGGAILHDRELTYCLVLPARHDMIRHGATRLYEIAHDALIACLSDAGVHARRSGQTDGSTPTRGPFFCFARRHCLDVLAGDDKLAGSAQRRTRRAVLQHGSIMFERRFEQQPTAAIRRMLPMSVDDFARHWVIALGDVTGMRFEIGAWAGAELALAAELTAKYTGDEWTRKR
ncbi:MAG: lipoate--protein ligase family protein [Phycisphaerales bacterium]|nr:MAG: lipoate--protein ligase family protein [Phycisphaerales bacterium]